MTNAVWPAGLPQDWLESGYKETPPANVIRTKMDVGPAKLRRRSTAMPRLIEGNIGDMTDAQVETLDAFYVTTLASGALPFDWTHPRTGASVVMQFAKEPSYTPNNNVWSAALSVEILP